MIIRRTAEEHAIAKSKRPPIIVWTKDPEPRGFDPYRPKNARIKDTKYFASQEYKTLKGFFLSKDPEEKQAQDKEVRAWSAAFCSAPC